MRVIWCPGASHYIPFFVQKRCVSHVHGVIASGRTEHRSGKNLAPPNRIGDFTFSEPMNSGKLVRSFYRSGLAQLFSIGL